MNRRLSQDVWVLIILFLFLVTSVAYMNSRKDTDDSGPVMPIRTTYSSNGYGMKALYKTLDKVGYPVKRKLSSLTDDPDDGVLFMISPMRPVAPEEWAPLRRWVERGNVLIVNSDDEHQDPTERTKSFSLSSVPACPSFLAPGVKSFRVPKWSSVSDVPWAFAENSALPAPFTAKRRAHKAKVLDVKKNDSWMLVPLFQDKYGTTAAYCRVGKGMVIMLASAWSVSNQGINKGDNLLLVLNAINNRDLSRKASVTFDEYHHGFGSAPGMWSLIDTPARLGLAQIGMAFLLLIFAVSVRFGRPIPLREGFRQRNEYLTSMSSLMRRAHALGVVKSELRRRFMQDIAVALHQSPRADADTILEAAAARKLPQTEELRKLLVDSWKQDGIDETALLTLAARWYHMRKELMKTR